MHHVRRPADTCESLHHAAASRDTSSRPASRQRVISCCKPGALRVDVASATTAVHRDRMRVIEVAFEFVEHGTTIFPSAYIATAVSVRAAAASSLVACTQDLGGVAAPAAAAGSAVTGEGQTVVSAFVAATTLGGADATGIVGMATALPPPDGDTSYGRYSAGSASLALPVGTTVVVAFCCNRYPILDRTPAVIAPGLPPNPIFPAPGSRSR
jgi:hypothetical protein